MLATPRTTPSPQPPSAAASTAILTMLAALTICALVITLLGAPDAPFQPQWPWQWAAVLTGVLGTLGVAIAFVWRERQLSLCWYSIAVTAQLAANETTTSIHIDITEAQQTAQEQAIAKAEELSSVMTTLLELAQLGTATLERQQVLVGASGRSSNPLSAPEPGMQPALGALFASPIAPVRSAAFDPVTGALTHTALMGQLEPDIDFAYKQQRSLALAVFDINQFHVVNDRHGYAFGDEVLFAVAERLRGLLHDGEILARLHTDRFVIVWPGMSSMMAQSAVERILGAMSSTALGIPTDDPNDIVKLVRITLRAGLVLCPDDGYTAQSLLSVAEDAIDRHARHAQVYPDRMQVSATPTSPRPDVTEHAEVPMSPPLALHSLPPMPLTESYTDVASPKHSSIQALTSALEAHDPDGVARARTLASLAERTAVLLGRSIEEARLVGLGALLHNVGNLGIPSEILEKPEALTEEEWSFVRRHPHLGERLLRTVGGVLAAVSSIVASQRERFDGKGYPAGLSGESIPLGARIVAVCAVYGTLIAERPYRPSFTSSEALDEVRRHSGSQFDPAVVEAFVTALSER